MSTRIVLDTNIFVGACLGSDAANQLLRLCLQDEVKALMGAALFSEYEDVIGRDDIFKNARLNADERQELLDIFLAHCEWTRIYYSWRPNLPDEADNHLIELAVAGGANFIVTRNLRDFVRAELRFANLQIMNPEDFIALLAKKE